MNVLGETWPDPFSKALGTNMDRFLSPTGVRGLARMDDSHLILLAVDAIEPGTGQFKAFIKQAKRECSAISVWHVFNPMLIKVLKRYGFKYRVETDQNTGERIPAYRWRKVWE